MLRGTLEKRYGDPLTVFCCLPQTITVDIMESLIGSQISVKFIEVDEVGGLASHSKTNRLLAFLFNSVHTIMSSGRIQQVSVV